MRGKMTAARSERRLFGIECFIASINNILLHKRCPADKQYKQIAFYLPYLSRIVARARENGNAKERMIARYGSSLKSYLKSKISSYFQSLYFRRDSPMCRPDVSLCFVELVDASSLSIADV